MTQYKKYDTYSETTYYVRLAQDARIFNREDGKGEDVVLTFCDNSRMENTEELWVDARLSEFCNDLGRTMKKGDVVQVRGKLRFRKNLDGTYRGKIFNARLATFANFGRAKDESGVQPEGDGDPVPPTFG